MTEPNEVPAAGKRVKVVRVLTEQNQDELGKKIGLDGPAISRFESGARKIDRDVARRLGEVLFANKVEAE